MARPDVGSATELLYASLGPWARADTARGLSSDDWQLLEMCEAIMGRLQPVVDLVYDSDTHVGWGAILDADAAPEEWLPWLAQFGGSRVRPGLGEAEQRARIKGLSGIWRGTPEAIKAAAAQYLDGTKTVFLVERHGSPYRLTVSVLASELTVDLATVEAVVREQKPAGIVMTVQTVIGNDYTTLLGTHASYDILDPLFESYGEVTTDPSKV